MKRMFRLSLSLVVPGALALVCGCPFLPINPGSGVTEWNSVRIDSTSGVSPVAVKAADLDGDGDLDAASVWRGPAGTGTTPNGFVAIHLQQSPSSWSTVIVDSGDVYAEVNGLAIGDINGDNRPDLVIAAMDRVVYLRAPANPRMAADWTPFDLQASFDDTFVAWFDVAIGQIDGVNGPDIAAALSQEDDGLVGVFLAPEEPDDDAGWTLEIIDEQRRSYADSVVLVDLDGDGRLDVVSSAVGETQGGISWYKAPADFAATDRVWTRHPISSFPGASRLAAGDLDGDGDTDLAAISVDQQRLAWLEHPADVTKLWIGYVIGQFTAEIDNRLPVDVTVADIDGDGANDIVMGGADPGTLSYFRAGADRKLFWKETFIDIMATAGSPGLFAAGDIDNDGEIDVIAPIDAVDDRNDRVSYYINPGPTTQPAEGS